MRTCTPLRNEGVRGDATTGAANRPLREKGFADRSVESAVCTLTLAYEYWRTSTVVRQRKATHESSVHAPPSAEGVLMGLYPVGTLWSIEKESTLSSSRSSLKRALAEERAT